MPTGLMSRDISLPFHWSMVIISSVKYAALILISFLPFLFFFYNFVIPLLHKTCKVFTNNYKNIFTRGFFGFACAKKAF